MLETETLSLKIPQVFKTGLRRLATREGESMAVVVRRILRDELRRNELLPTPTGQPTPQESPNGN